ncbi:Lsa family ABC-F type ribosomal protection protein [Eubacteriales bacterium]|nr:Lsa family ABC-F type ribosomal protection protein [Eubacteriales bacterium]GKH62140.1 Lsa family ABC-F type ribosomal protection protein [Eubacteriales bacterium]
MSQIRVSNLSFCHAGSFDPVFREVSFVIDTDWRLGFIGRNGRGKTTFLQLLMGRYPYSGSIEAPVSFSSFPFEAEDPGAPARTVLRESVAPYRRWELAMESLLNAGDEDSLREYGELLERYQAAGGYTVDASIEREAGLMGLSPELLDRPFDTLSYGERTRLQLCSLFLRPNGFALIDEPTNHLDAAGRERVAGYLAAKQGFLLVSHDRDLLDRTVDHILSINRADIEVQQGNYSSWQENRDRRDSYERTENERLKKDIARLRSAARQKADWSQVLERTKIGHKPDGQLAPDRGFVGHRAAKAMKRAKSIEKRQEKALAQKEGLLKNIEKADELRITPLPWRGRLLAEARELSISYGKPLFEGLSFFLEEGDRAALTGPNGCGKSSILRLLVGEEVPHTGMLSRGRGLIVSYVPQDASFLSGTVQDYALREGIDRSLFFTILRKFDFPRSQFEKDMAGYSGGQKKKVLLARSLCERAHLYIWDEPLNFIDLLSRVQIERLLGTASPAMLFVEHDRRFVEQTANKVIALRTQPPAETGKDPLPANG